MILFDETKKTVEFDLENMLFIGKGMFGKVYKINDNTCLKIFGVEHKRSEKILKKIRDLELDSYYNIYDLYHDEEKRFFGYSMKYYDNSDIDILGISKDYLLENYETMFEDIAVISKKLIEIIDLNYNNVIYTNEGIVIIDADLYRFSTASKKHLKYINNKYLQNLYINMILQQLEKKYGYDRYQINRMRNILLDYFYEKIDNPKVLERKLGRYEKPIEFVRYLERKRK